MAKLMSRILPIVVLLIAALWWTSAGHDDSLRLQMLPVKISLDGGRILFVSPYEVTVSTWQRCYAEGQCSYLPKSSTSTSAMPVSGINWFDVNEYLAWANKHSSVPLRLPSLAEWRELNRSLEKPKQPPAFTDPRLAWAANYGQENSPIGPIRPSGSFSKTPDGIYDLDGNVWEWTSTCYKPGFEGTEAVYCPAFVTAGAHEAVTSVFIRNPALGGCATGTPPSHIGFRLVADE